MFPECLNISGYICYGPANWPYVLVQRFLKDSNIFIFSSFSCFFSYKDGSIWYFVAPVLVVMLVSFYSFIPFSECRPYTFSSASTYSAIFIYYYVLFEYPNY